MGQPISSAFGRGSCPAISVGWRTPAAPCGLRKTLCGITAWNIILRKSAAGCGNGMYTFRKASEVSLIKKRLWCLRCMAIPAPARFTQGIRAGRRSPGSMALSWCFPRQSLGRWGLGATICRSPPGTSCTISRMARMNSCFSANCSGACLNSTQ